MHLLELWLPRFGPFTDLKLDFSGLERGVHIVFGPNEAGKSTTLSALEALFFRFPQRTAFDFLHQKKELRVGARLGYGAGQELAFFRKRGKKLTLLDTDGQPLDESLLESAMPGVDRELFASMFGLSHEALQQGGHAILAGEGNLAQSLFGAGVGSDMHSLLKRLSGRAEKLFMPRASKPQINAALSQFGKARKRVSELRLSARKWDEEEGSFQELLESLQSKDTEVRAARRELARLERVRRNKPKLARHQTVGARLAALATTPLLPEDAAEQLKGAQRSLRDTRPALAGKQAKLGKIVAQLASLSAPEALAEDQERLRELGLRLGAHMKADRDRPVLMRGLLDAKDAMKRLLAELGVETSVDAAENLRVPGALKARIAKLGKALTGLESRRESLTGELASLRQRKQALESTLAGRRSEDDGKALAGTLKIVSDEGPIEKQSAEARSKRDRLRSKLERQRAALGRVAGTAEDIARLALPNEETVRRFERSRDRLETEHEKLGRQLEEAQREKNRLEAELKAHERAGEVVTENDLRRARERREQLWKQLRSAWFELSVAAETDKLACADQLEEATQRADEIADRLRREAERVARHVQLEVQRDARIGDITELAAKLKAVVLSQAEDETRWRQPWVAVGIEAGTPKEMAAWLGRHEKLVGVFEEAGEAAQVLADVEERVAAAVARLRKALSGAGATSAPDAGLAELRAQAEALVEARRTEANETLVLQRELNKLSEKLPGLERELADSERMLTDWRTQWCASLAQLGRDVSTTPDEADLVLALIDQLLEKDAERRSHHRRIAGIDRDAEAFEAFVDELVVRYAPELQARPLETRAQDLSSLYSKARDEKTSREGLVQRKAELETEIETEAEKQRRAEATVAELSAAAGVAAIEALEEAVLRSDERRALQGERERLERDMLEGGDGHTLATLIDEAAQVDGDAISGDVDHLRAELERLEEMCRGLRDERAALLERRKQLGSEGAATAQEEAEAALSQVRAGSEEYLVVRLASLLLEKQIERYSEQHQGPLLSRSSELFARLTLGSFSQLKPEWNLKDQKVIACVRPDGSSVHVDGLSEGTRDQLYLALRLASLEQHLAKNEGFPLICDDLLVQFDDQRARAALELLGELGEQTQVLFFTHHRRLVELAAAAIPKERRRDHDLSAALAARRRGS